MTTLNPSRESHAAESRTSARRVAILCLVLLLAAVGMHFTPVRAWLSDIKRLHRTVQALGVWTYPATVLTVAILVFLGVPRLLFFAAGGLVLGFWPGLILAEIGTLLGSYGMFLLVRRGAGERSLARSPSIAKLAEAVQNQGTLGVILLRQLPVHGTIVNICLGLSRVKHRHFILGSAIGMLTEAIPATLIGAGLVKRSFESSAVYLVIAAAAAALVWISCTWWLRAVRSTPDGSQLITQAAQAEMENHKQ